MKNIRLATASFAKKLALALALVCAAKFTASAAVDLGAATDRTPYDRFLNPVQQVFSTLRPEGATMARVQGLMRQGRAFGYHHFDKFLPATPDVTAARQQGDCKDKALWLMNQMQDNNVRFVIGKYRRSSRENHAWLMWQNGGQWWILDCTMVSAPIAANSVGMDEYVPLFSYSRGVAFRHTDKAGLVAEAGNRSKTGV